jgi:hypothetical protein
LVHISCELFLACVFVSSRDAPTLAITTTDLKPSGYPLGRYASLSSISHTQKGPRDASEAVLAGGPLRVHEAATRVRDLEWPS